MSLGRSATVDPALAHEMGRQGALTETNSHSIIDLEGEMRSLRKAITSLTIEIHRSASRAAMTGALAGACAAVATIVVLVGIGALFAWLLMSGHLRL